jgi:beta-lactamase class A
MKALSLLIGLALATPAPALDRDALTAAARAQETALGARVGAAVLDTANGETWGYRADERFPLDSTHKAFACAALLAKVDAGEIALDRSVSIAVADLVANSPITEKLTAPQKPTLADMCAAALAVSDNTAANVVLAALGGPAGVTAFFRRLGDSTSRLDRTETALNEATPGDPRDTTTPAAVVADLDKILLGDVLKPASRARLTDWMKGDRVAAPLLRAALPPGWTIADKTGAGGHGSRGIVAVIWPPGRAPLVAAVYISETTASMDARNAAIANFGAALVKAIGP